MLGSLFVSCEETPEVDEYANWKERNEAYIHTIAQTAETNADGKWMKILSFKLDSIDHNGTPVKHDVEDYVYCHIEAQSDGTTHPLYTDLVSVNYRGRLMPTNDNAPGKMFDESYKGTFSPALNVPRNFSMGDLIVGWSTALMHMTKGDAWRVYIPAALGYGAKEKGDIPAHSVLVFDIHLAGFSSEMEE